MMEFIAGSAVGILAAVLVVFFETMSRNHEGRLVLPTGKTPPGGTAQPPVSPQRTAWLRKRARDAGYGQ